MIRRGSYLLFLTFSEPFISEIGALGTLDFSPGTYCYVGSANNGLDQRISRHLSKEKKVRWHIDRLTLLADFMEAFETQISECELAKITEDSGGVPAVKGFGCSDCKCQTHLFKINDKIREILIQKTKASAFTDMRKSL